MSMRKIMADDPLARSADPVEGNIERLKTLFPEAFTEGKIDFEVLKQLLGGHVEEREEKYGLNWHGKRMARRLALTPSTGTLRPCPEESVDWDGTQNILIEGDNLEVLKLLQKSYAGKVKMIYIDPPYNTGKDFVYPDDFRDNIRNYLELTGQVDGEGRRVSSNTEASGRFHTDWLNMMYPRLKLARNLLRDDGVMFISIADHEVHDLRLVMDEVFGEENFIAAIIWQKMYSPKNSARHFSEDHDYVIVYAKNSETWEPNLLPRTKEMEARYTNKDNDPRGPWKPGDLSARNYYGEGTYAISCPSGKTIEGPPPGRYWSISKEKFDELDKDSRIWWGGDGNNTPSVKRFLSEVKTGRVPQTLWKYEEVGHTQEAKKELIASVTFPNSDSVFETPKPTRLIQRMLHLATQPNNNELVVDFFAGSGSTLHGVFKKNIEDEGNRHCILVQIPEPLQTGGKVLSTISDLTKERLRRAGQKIKEETPLFAGDTGFRVFKLDTSNIRPWQPDREDLEKNLLDHSEHLVEGRGEGDILFELLLKLGLELTVPMERRTIAGKNVHSIGLGALMVCLAEQVTREDVEPLALGIRDWWRQLAPAVPVQFVFLDRGFVDDVAKTNLVAILEQNIPSDQLAGIRSL